jgi:predicted RNase H-like HicB family nuclease
VPARLLLGHGEAVITLEQNDRCRRENQKTAAAGRVASELISAHKFDVIYEDAGDGWVCAHVPELPEVQTQGKSLDQARDMVRDAIELVLEERRARGEPIPPTGWALVESVEIAA